MSNREYATQIWPLRESFGEDMSGTLKRIAQMGFAGVELCRWFHWTDMFDKWPADEIQQVCEEFGLKVVSAHISYPTIFEENLEDLVRFCRMVGMRYAVVASIPEELVDTREDFLGVVDQFNRSATILKPEGIRLGYHSHGLDFKPLPGNNELPWVIFFDNTDSQVVMQIDISHTLKAGADPIHYLKKYPGRAKLVHLREYAVQKPTTAIGDGEVDWVRIFEVCEQFHQPDWYIIEQEVKDYDPWKSAEESLKYLQSLRW